MIEPPYARRYPERHWQSLTALNFLLLPLSWIYCAGMQLRRVAYRSGLKRVRRLPVPVIVVGNISVGGTGKTPLVLWLAGVLKRAGFVPGIITRGYGGNTTVPTEVTIDAQPARVGDEPLLLARRAGCPVFAGRDRAAAAQALLQRHPCDVILSDDGLQHYALARTVEIAVIDGVRRFGNGRCLPAGPLREPQARLRQVDACVTNGSAAPGEWGMRLLETGFYNLRNPETHVDAGYFRGRPVHAVAGIGHPQRFFEQLRRLGLEIIEHPFPDHHRFHIADLRFDHGDTIVMTEKDAIKCTDFAQEDHWYLRVEAQPDAGLDEFILQRLQEKTHG